jgi:hypothetical protein
MFVTTREKSCIEPYDKNLKLNKLEHKDQNALERHRRLYKDLGEKEMN